jgi:electron transfer flavoprotein beta subunit
MKIVVCIKQVPDPEAPASAFKIDPATNRVVPPAGVPPVVNGFDEQAVEAALRIKDKKADTQVLVLSVGPDGAREAIKKALAMGADEGYLVNDRATDDSDAFGTSYILAQAIKKIGGADLVLCGRQASDWDQARVPSGIAEQLGLPCVTLAKAVALQTAPCELSVCCLTATRCGPLPCPRSSPSAMSWASPVTLPSRASWPPPRRR